MQSHLITDIQEIIDMFCGAGGFTEGIEQAAKLAGIKVRVSGINHWKVAIATYGTNHPEANYFCGDVNSVEPWELVPSRRVKLVTASPECIYHSNARGTRTVANPQSRASAFRVLEYVDPSRVIVDEVLIENVVEFLKWGPLEEVIIEKVMRFSLPLPSFEKWYPKTSSRNGGTVEEWTHIYNDLVKLGNKKDKVSRRVKLTCWVPIKSREGESFVAFIEMLKSFGFTAVEWRVLNACDFGGATSRKRLFIRASRSGRVVWPEPTHAGPTTLSKQTSRQLSVVTTYHLRPHRTAEEILDLDDIGKSIFDRDRLLTINTLARLFQGLDKICGIRLLDGGGQPLPIAEINDLVALRQPFLLKYYGGHFGQPITKPLPTLTANYEHYALVTPVPIFPPFVLEFRNHIDARSLKEPISTIATSGNHHGLVQPIARPFIVEMRNGQEARSIDPPLPTITTKGMHHAPCRPFILPVNHGKGDLRSYSLNRAFPTITSVDAWAVAQAVKKPFLVKYNSTGGAIDLEEPLHTVTARDRFGLISPQIIEDGTVFFLDIYFRMLHEREMARAMGFPDTYIFMGNKREDNVKLIGNAVSVDIALALGLSIFKPEMVARLNVA